MKLRNARCPVDLSVASQAIIDQIREKVAKRVPVQMSHPQFRISSILIPLIEGNEGLDLVLTLRSSKLKKHKGEVSFPGGKFSPKKDRTTRDTALREAHEEVNIVPEQVTILGELDDFCTLTRFIIHPVVGHVAPPYDFRPNEGEVAEVFMVPLSFLRDPQNFKETMWPMGDVEFPIYSFPYKKFNIWGATAHVLVNFLEVIFGINLPSKPFTRPTPEDLLALNSKEQR